MKAIFIFSNKTGHGLISKRIPLIKEKLKDVYEFISFRECKDIETLRKAVVDCSNEKSDLLFAGGDGTFNLVVNEVMKCDYKPTLGYFPSGTINDAGHNFGLFKNVQQAIKSIKKGYVKTFDICKTNNQYFVYVAAIGAFADIAYDTQQKNKKFFGKIAYYYKAVIKALEFRKIKVTVKVNGDIFSCNTPFVLVLNGRNVGGFCVNRKANLNDGKFDVFLTKPGIFNGLLHYLFFKIKTISLRTSEIEIIPNCEDFWCLDGEKGMQNAIKIVSVPSALRIYSLKK